MKNNRSFVSFVRCSVHLLMLFLLALAIGANYVAYALPGRYAMREDLMWTVSLAIFVIEAAVGAYIFKRNEQRHEIRFHLIRQTNQPALWGGIFSVAAIGIVVLKDLAFVRSYLVVALFLVLMASGMVTIMACDALKLVTTSEHSYRIYRYLAAIDA